MTGRRGFPKVGVACGSSRSDNGVGDPFVKITAVSQILSSEGVKGRDMSNPALWGSKAAEQASGQPGLQESQPQALSGNAGTGSSCEGSALPMSDEEFSAVVKEILERLDKVLGKVPVRYDYTVHPETQTLVLKVIDRTTQEVIRVIPPEELLDIRARIKELVGLILDEKR